jgi:hypothetical protein
MPANAQPDNGSKRGNNPHFEAGKLPALKGEVYEHREQRSASSTLLQAQGYLVADSAAAFPPRREALAKMVFELTPNTHS